MEVRRPISDDLLSPVKKACRENSSCMIRQLSFALLALCYSSTVNAEAPKGRLCSDVIDGISWTFQITDEDTAVVGGWNDDPYAISSKTEGNIVIPDSFRGCPTVYIGWCAFSGRKYITSVSIPNTVTNIGIGAFNECKKLSSIRWPSELKEIRNTAFAECSSLTSIVLPSGLKHICTQAFRGCTALTNVEIPSTILYVDDAAFKKCKSLPNISLPEGLLGIHDFVFEDCIGLTSIGIPASTLTVGRGLCAGSTNVISIIASPSNPNYTSVNGVLYDKVLSRIVAYPPALKSFVVEPSVTCIGKSACYKAYCLRTIHFPESLTKIESTAFQWCTGVSSIIIPPKVQTSGDHAFYACTALCAVTFPKSVEKVGESAFESCPIRVIFVERGDAERVRTVLKNSKMAVDNISFVELPVAAMSMNWTDDYYQRFSNQYDPDIETAMKMPSGKRTATGEEMFVRQDFVAGTDPLDACSKFEASITLVSGKPVVSWSPELKPEQAALRKYTVLGKAHLYDEKWSVVDDDTEKYGFFKVAVEMK